ncbi:hypothetical protein F5X97DRAFT_294806 [Nemania serpens]|nr:hypothetical protein F5X97DRAFT_294806 [Nemania serpens]
MSNEITTTTSLPPAMRQDRVGALPPVELMCSSDADADTHHTRILAVRGLYTTATGDALRTLAGLALHNFEMTVSASSVSSSSNDAATVTTLDTTEAGAVTVHNDESGQDGEIRFLGNHDNDDDDDEEVSDYSLCLSVPRGVEFTFEPFYFFFYGSLQIRSVLRNVCDIEADEDDEDDAAIFLPDASIFGWEVKMWGCFPALVPAIADADADDEDEGGLVDGVAWLCEKHEHVARLCRYETEAYRMAYCDVWVPAADGDGVEVLGNARTFVSVLAAEELGRGAFDVDAYQNNKWRVGGS